MTTATIHTDARITDILHTVLESDMYDNTDGIDVHLSTNKYVDMLKAALRAEFPGVNIMLNVRGRSERPLETSVLFDTGYDAATGDAVIDDDYRARNRAADSARNKIAALQNAILERRDWIIKEEEDAS